MTKLDLFSEGRDFPWVRLHRVQDRGGGRGGPEVLPGNLHRRRQDRRSTMRRPWGQPAETAEGKV